MGRMGLTVKSVLEAEGTMVSTMVELYQSLEELYQEKWTERIGRE